MIKTLKGRIREAMNRRALPPEARAEQKRDRRGLPPEDPGIPRTIEAAMGWLCRAQDQSRSGDGGVARVYNLVHGWSSSYPETTGYIVPTFLEYAARTGSVEIRSRARRMANWLSKIQMPSGAFQGGKVDSKPVLPVAFNTGQILFGLASADRAFGGFRQQLIRAADWLVQAQDSDGCWRKFASPFAGKGDKSYDTHTAWGLIEADRLEPDRGYGRAALANVEWALQHQHDNGWVDHCCLSDSTKPLTHTLGYFLRGVLEAYLYTQHEPLLAAARKTADGLLSALKADGFLPGQLSPDWSGSARWACLTGTVQVAACWLILFRETGETRYLDAAVKANQFVRRTVLFEGSPDVVGAVKGSFPIGGGYGRFEYPNWAAKFLIDSLLLEGDIRGGEFRFQPTTVELTRNGQI